MAGKASTPALGCPLTTEVTLTAAPPPCLAAGFHLAR
jgi:hypothetical protein